MNIVIPMAGRGTRMRPHTLTTPKPLLPIAGQPIVERLVRSLANLVDDKIDKIGFIIGEDFGEEVEEFLKEVARRFDAEGHIFYQRSPEGIAHALLCAEELLTGKTIVALSDTLFISDKSINTQEDGVLFVQQVEDPSAFGVVDLNDNGVIEGLVEKPKDFVSDLAMIGIYYFKNGDALKEKMQYLLDNDIRTKGEYQITDAIELLRKEGAKLKTQQVDEWLDCGNKNAIVHTNQRILEKHVNAGGSNGRNGFKNTIIIEPCYLAEDVTLENCIIGPHVSVEQGTTIKKSVISNSIIQSNTNLENKVLTNSMLGNHVRIIGTVDSISVGDYSFNEG